MHEHPSNLGLCDLAVVSEEPTTTALIVHSDTVEGHIDGVSGAVVMWSQERLLVRTIPDHEVHKRPWWFVKVSGEDSLLERSDIEVEHIEPFLVETDLVHVNISCRHSFIAAFQPLIVIAAIAPFAKVFSLCHKVCAESLGEHREPVNVRTRLLGVLESHARRVVWVEVPQFPVVPVPLHLPELVVQAACFEVFGIDEVTKVESVRDVDELSCCSDVRHESHVRIQHLVHIRWTGSLVVDQTSLDEVAIRHKWNIPKASSVVVHNLHVVKGTRVVSIRGQTPPKVAPRRVGSDEHGSQYWSVLLNEEFEGVGVVQLDLGVNHKEVVTLNVDAFLYRLIPHSPFLLRHLMPNHLDAVVLVLVLLSKLLNFLFMELHCVVDEQVDAVLLIDEIVHLLPELIHERGRLLDEDGHENSWNLDQL